MDRKTICLIVAAICFALAAFNVPHLNWTAAGFFFVTLSFIIPPGHV
jgi:hypothetical protein